MRFLVLALVFFQMIGISALAAAAEETVRIGWQVPWAVQGQIVQILKHTDILKKNGLKAEFIGRSFGPELNELAVAGSVDVILTADQPAIVLFSKDKGWKAIGRLMYNRTATYVPINSEISSIQDLKGKKVGVPVGAAAERILREALAEVKMDPSKDVTIVNLGILEHGPLVAKHSTEKKWGDFDAMSGFDPTPAILESKKIARVIHTGKVISMVLMSDALAGKSPQVRQKLMQSIFDAYDYYRQNTVQVNSWFLEEAKLAGVDQQVCDVASQLEPNLKVKGRSQISLALTPDDIQKLKSISGFLKDQVKTQVEVLKYVDQEPAKNLK